MKINLTDTGATSVSMLRGRAANLEPMYGRNTFDRVAFENSHIPASVIVYAIGNPSDDDLIDMCKQGYATRWHRNA